MAIDVFVEEGVMTKGETREVMGDVGVSSFNFHEIERKPLAWYVGRSGVTIVFSEKEKYMIFPLIKKLKNWYYSFLDLPYTTVGGFCSKKHKLIFIFCSVNPKSVLADTVKHELLHFSEEKHCQKVKCLFYHQRVNHVKKSFCDKCQNKFLKVVDGLKRLKG